MTYYLYIMSDGNRENIHVGYCNDIIKAIKFYNGIPSMHWPKLKINILVYMEAFILKNSAIDRLNELTRMSKSEKEKLIESANPNWIELAPGVNIEM